MRRTGTAVLAFLGAASVYSCTCLALGPVPAAVLGLLPAMLWVLLVYPMAFLILFAMLVPTSISLVLSQRFGLPSVGGPIVWMLAASLLARTAFGRETMSGTIRIILPLGFYLICRTLSVAFVQDTGPTTSELIELAKDLVMVLVIVGFLTSMTRVRTIVATAGFSIAALAALADFQYVTGTFQQTYFGLSNAVLRQISLGDSDGWRLTGPLEDANYFGQLLVLGLPLVSVFALTRSHLLVRVLSVGAVIAISLAILFTYSRGAFVAIAIMAVIVGLSQKRWSQYLAAGAGLAAVVVIAVPKPSGFLNRLIQTTEAITALFGGGQWVSDPALAERLSVIKVALSMAAANPWFGIGMGQFPVQYGYYALIAGYDVGAPAAPHSLYLETLSEGGILGLTLLMCLAFGTLYLARLARLGLAARGATADALLVRGVTFSLVGYLTTSIFLHGAYHRLFWLVVAILLAIYYTAQFNPRASASLRPPSIWRSPSMPPREKFADTLWLLWSWNWLIAAFAAIGLAWGVATAEKKPQDYAATQTLLYRFGREYFPVTPGEARGEAGANVQLSLDNALSTEMTLLKSHTLFEKTAESAAPHGFLDAVGTPRPPEAWSDDADTLARKFDVARVQGAAMVTVSLRDSDPDRADTLLAAQVDGYLALRRQIFDTSATEFYDARIHTALDTLAQVTAKRAALLASHTGTAAATSAAAQTDLVIALQPIDAGIAAAQADLTALANERAAASLSEEYRKSVSPVVLVVDGKAARGNPVGLSPKGNILVGLASGVVFGIAAAFLFAMLLLPSRAARPGRPAPRLTEGPTD